MRRHPHATRPDFCCCSTCTTTPFWDSCRVLASVYCIIHRLCTWEISYSSNLIITLWYSTGKTAICPYALKKIYGIAFLSHLFHIFGGFLSFKFVSRYWLFLFLLQVASRKTIWIHAPIFLIFFFFFFFFSFFSFVVWLKLSISSTLGADIYKLLLPFLPGILIFSRLIINKPWN